jgi:hypothetical protein
MFNYVSYLVSREDKNLATLNVYSNMLNADSSASAWKFYANLFNKESGLYNSNFHKSILLELVSNDHSLRYKHNSVVKYISTFKAYHFSTTDQTYKKMFFMFASAMPSNYQSYNISLDTYNSYIWLNWYFKVNPLNNAFYFKIYNY